MEKYAGRETLELSLAVRGKLLLFPFLQQRETRVRCCDSVEVYLLREAGT